MRIRAVIFDFDLTLFDTAPGVVHCMREAFVAIGLDGPADIAIRRSIGLPLRDALRSVSPHELSMSQTEQMEQAFLAAAAIKMVELTTEIPGAGGALWKLRRAGFRIGIVTGKHRARVVQTLKRYDLTETIDTLVCGDDNVPGKPSPEGIRRALAAVNVRPEATVVVGDHPNDVLAAQAAGAGSCAVATGTHSVADLWRYSPTWVIDSLDRLPVVLGVGGG